MSVRYAIAAILALWAVGAMWFPLGGVIHFLLIAALIVAIIARFGRSAMG